MSLETMTKLATVTVGVGGSSTITFSNIPQTYTDLVVKMSARTSRSAVYGEMYMRFNSATTGYSAKALEGTGSSAGSYSETDIRVEFNGNTSTASIFGNAEFYISNYTSNTYKPVSLDSVTENNSTSVDSFFKAQLWSNTAPITQIDIGYGTGTIMQYSTFTLYGVKAMRTAMPLIGWASGGIITTDNTYIYHTFAQSNIFVANNSLKDVEYLVVAGGGGGGSFGGGGGAGGLRTQYLSLLDKGAYTIVVGAGGAGGTSNLAGSNGTSSFFNNYTTSGGGGGGGYTIDGASGGSGGGGGAQGGGFLRVGGAGNAGSYYPVEGYAGGRNYGTAAPYGAGGGGGAGAVGVDATSTTSGAGGAGSSSFSAWGLATSTGQNVSGTYWYAGGGGGASNNAYGSGGNGGGGSGANAGVSGTVSTGGGGGGANSSQLGGGGGSGVVIVRYKG